MRRAVIVTRVSTGEQTKGTSLQSQLERGRVRAESLGFRIVAEYEDAGVSGALLNTRQGMQAAINDIKARRAEVLICDSLSRYSRDEEHQHRIKREIRTAGGTIVFCDMDIDLESPEGEFMFAVNGSMQAWERRKTRERTARGRIARALSGVQPARSKSPYGYHIVNTNDVIRGEYPGATLGTYIVLEPQANVVRRIFSMYASGLYSMEQICRALNSDTVPPPKHALTWRVSTLSCILSNPVYKGQGAYGKTRWHIDETRLQRISSATGRYYSSMLTANPVPEEEWITISSPPIVSPDEWSRASKRRKINVAIRSGSPANVRIVSGVIYCPGCGGKMAYNRRNSAVNGSYFCRDHIARRQTGQQYRDECAIWYNGSHVESAAVEAILLRLHATDMQPSVLAANHPTVVTPPNLDMSALNAIRAELLSVRERTRAVTRAHIQAVTAGADGDEYLGALRDLREQQRDLEKRIKPLNHEVSVPSHQGRVDSVATVSLLFDQVRTSLTSRHIPTSTRRNLCTLVVSRVVPRRGGAHVFFVDGTYLDVDAPKATNASKALKGEQ